LHRVKTLIQSQDLNPKKTAKNRKVTIKAKYVYV